MREPPTSPLLPLLKTLERRDSITEQERQVILGLPAHERSYRRHEEIVAEHSRPTESCVMIAGYAARSVSVESGKRQITALHICGDFTDLHGMLLKVMDHSIVALTDCRVAFVPHRAIVEATAQLPHLARMFWLLTVIDGAIQRAWMAGLSRRSPVSRLAHLICEIQRRFEVVGQAGDHRLELPITQAELADLLGISIVHANRTVQDLRATGCVRWKGSLVEILDLGRLTAIAEFDDTYLNLVHVAR